MRVLQTDGCATCLYTLAPLLPNKDTAPSAVQQTRRLH